MCIEIHHIRPAHDPSPSVLTPSWAYFHQNSRQRCKSQPRPKPRAHHPYYYVTIHPHPRTNTPHHSPSIIMAPLPFELRNKDYTPSELACFKRCIKKGKKASKKGKKAPRAGGGGGRGGRGPPGPPGPPGPGGGGGGGGGAGGGMPTQMFANSMNQPTIIARPLPAPRFESLAATRTTPAGVPVTRQTARGVTISTQTDMPVRQPLSTQSGIATTSMPPRADSKVVDPVEDATNLANLTGARQAVQRANLQMAQDEGRRIQVRNSLEDATNLANLTGARQAVQGANLQMAQAAANRIDPDIVPPVRPPAPRAEPKGRADVLIDPNDPIEDKGEASSLGESKDILDELLAGAPIPSETDSLPSLPRPTRAMDQVPTGRGQLVPSQPRRPIDVAAANRQPDFEVAYGSPYDRLDSSAMDIVQRDMARQSLERATNLANLTGARQAVQGANLQMAQDAANRIDPDVLPLTPSQQRDIAMFDAQQSGIQAQDAIARINRREAEVARLAQPIRLPRFERRRAAADRDRERLGMFAEETRQREEAEQVAATRMVRFAPTLQTRTIPARLAQSKLTRSFSTESTGSTGSTGSATGVADFPFSDSPASTPRPGQLPAQIPAPSETRMVLAATAQANRMGEFNRIQQAADAAVTAAAPSRRRSIRSRPPPEAFTAESATVDNQRRRGEGVGMRRLRPPRQTVQEAEVERAVSREATRFDSEQAAFNTIHDELNYTEGGGVGGGGMVGGGIGAAGVDAGDSIDNTGNTEGPLQYDEL